MKLVLVNPLLMLRIGQKLNNNIWYSSLKASEDDRSVVERRYDITGPAFTTEFWLGPVRDKKWSLNASSMYLFVIVSMISKSSHNIFNLELGAHQSFQAWKIHAAFTGSFVKTGEVNYIHLDIQFNLTFSSKSWI